MRRFSSRAAISADRQKAFFSRKTAEGRVQAIRRIRLRGALVRRLMLTAATICYTGGGGARLPCHAAALWQRRPAPAGIVVPVIEMRLISPPVGVNVFVVKGVAEDVPMGRIFAGIMPFWVAMRVCIALLVAFPQIALFLPNSMYN